MSKLLICLSVILALSAHADTPPPGSVKSKTFSGDGLTPISATGGSLNVNVTGSTGATTVNQGTTPWAVSGTVTANQGSPPWSIALPAGASTSALQTSGNSILSNILAALAAPISVEVSNFPATQVVDQGTSPWVTSVSNFPAVFPVTQSTTPWTISGSVSATQSGAWTTGRTWALSSGTDSVNVGNFPASVSVTQGTSPWVTSGDWLTNAQLRASPVPVTGTVSVGTPTVNQGTTPWVVDGSGFTQPVSGSLGRTWTLASGTDSVTSIQGTSPWVSSISNFPATQAVTQATSPWVVSGTVTANIGTTGGLALDSTLAETHGSATGGVAAASSGLVGGIFNSTPPTLLDGEQASLQFDVNGNLKTTASISGSTSVTQGTSPWVVSGSVGRTWTLSSGTDSVSLGAGAATIGSVNQGTSPWVVSGSVSASQSGVWSVGRTWALSSGTDSVSVSQGSSPWVTEVAEFGGAPVVTGTGPSGAGIPRVTVANDSNILATQSGSWTTGRTWALSSGTDSVAVTGTVSVGTPTVNQGTSPWIVDGSGFTQPVSGSLGRTWTLSSGTDSVSVGNFPATQAVTQSTSPWVTSVSNFPATQAVTQSTSPWVVSGSVTANIGTTGGLALDATLAETHGSASGGTAAAKSDLSGGIFNSTPPTLTNGQQASLQLDSSGNLKTTASLAGTIGVTQSTTPWVENVSQFGGSNVVTGTGASGAGIPRVTVSNDSNVLATQSGTWNINNITGTVSLPTGAATETSLAKLTLAQGSTTSGQAGPLIQGAVTTAAPSYTTAQTSPLSLTTTGHLRVDNSANTQPVNITQVGGASLTLGQKTSANSVPVVFPSDQTITVSSTAAQKTTYSAATANFATAATATDVCTITGSATKTIRVTAAQYSATQTTIGYVVLNLIKRSTANSGGTSTTLTNVPLDSNNAAATATVRNYTANPTVGTAVGTIESRRALVGENTIDRSPVVEIHRMEFGKSDDISQPIVLRGTSEVLAINLNGKTLAGNNTTCVFQWTEE